MHPGDTLPPTVTLYAKKGGIVCKAELLVHDDEKRLLERFRTTAPGKKRLAPNEPA
jgi:hypothetical protein